MESRNCLICTVPITVTHLGFDACRACAAFFKRSKMAKRVYTCRQGNKKCTFRKHEKFMCRSCRYDKCVELGMVYVAPPKRKPRKRVEVEIETSPGSSSSSSMSSMTSANESILDRMGSEYKASCDRRLPQEKHYAVLHKLKKIDHPTEELFLSNVSSFYEVFRISIKESIICLQNVFPEFVFISVPHRATLFKNFLGKFCMVEGVYLSSKHFKSSFNFMTSLITFVDCDDVEGWVTDEDNIERKEDFQSSLKGFSKEYIELLAPMLKMEKLMEKEFHALMALAYCDVDPSHHLPEEIIDSVERTRAKVFEELQEYYRSELKLNDFSKRLGNLMTIAHGAREAGNLMSEEMRMYATMFGVYSDDQLFRELFLE